MPWQPKQFAVFLCRFVVIYLIFSPPWTGWDRIYGSFFRTLGGAVFHDNDQRELAFETPGKNSPRPLDTRIEIANRALLHADGSGPVRDFDLDARAFAWDPMALLAALILATAIPWRRKLRALLWGALSLQAVILLFLAFSIWNESAQIGLGHLTPFWQSAADAATDFIVTQTRLALPPLIWILVTFRREDWHPAMAPESKPGALAVSQAIPFRKSNSPYSLP